ncbi:biotin--[acetyl-CoA-carboxylase] ligase [Calothrix sp. 336/3]|uniref:biotin--[acetyl-CoA-carboxylase] ligase n=1 Tax=Calothrix sp. 336/3 TaxID=1337936 RepID=UPI0006243908|nr:biotin--[acetyl-CoA-carboxylase] ligase [Calothrix sp. 336/3]AKG23914.1 biotin--acetyl-CoA-carboxylase ligase [Calothrix sp. 336/3]
MGLNRDKLELALQKESKSTHIPFSLHILETVDSTNKALWSYLAAGAKTGTVVIATQQTAGRGQWGRQWVSPGGGLYLSVALQTEIAASNSYQLTFATAWGIAQGLRQQGVPVGIKWPNDLVINQRKLGGILTETKIQQGKITQAVIGVGINWDNQVPETGISLQSWQRANNSHQIPDLESLAAKVLWGIESGIQCFFQEGVNILMSHYLELLINIGDRVAVNEESGTVVGVNPQGELCVRMDTPQFKKLITSEICLQPGTISLGYKNSVDSGREKGEGLFCKLTE